MYIAREGGGRGSEKRQGRVKERGCRERMESTPTHRVTPAAQMSALKPDHESCPEAISGG